MKSDRAWTRVDGLVFPPCSPPYHVLPAATVPSHGNGLLRRPASREMRRGVRCERPSADAATPLGLEGVGDSLLERHLSTDIEGNGKALLTELGYQRASRLFAQALLIGQRGVSGFLT